MKNAMILLVASLILVIIGLCIVGVLIVWYNWMDKLVHYLFVPGDKRFTSKVRAKFLKTHVRFYNLTGKHDLAAFY